MRTIQAIVTFCFEDDQVSERLIKDRLEALLGAEFERDVTDVETRWCAPSEVPRFRFGRGASAESAAPNSKE
jgi:hypothetical protein